MNFKSASILATSAFALGIWILPAQALTVAECSTKYQAAKTAGTLKGATWNQFRKSDCADDANPLKTAAPAAAQAAPAPTPAAATAKPAAVAPSAANAVFPKVIDPKYAKEKPAAQRMKTCLDQYRINKAGNGNGGLNWIMKGGGYYSECNKVLKGA